MVLAGVGVLGLGFVVAMASASVPGRQKEPLLDINWRPGTSVSTILTWVVIITAVIGAAALMLAVKQPRMRGERKGKRVLLVLIVAVLLFALAWRYLRPAAQSLLAESSELLPGVTDAPPQGSAASNASNPIWVLGALVALMVTVALVRLGMSLRAPMTELFSDDVFAEASAGAQPVEGVARLRGIDPRSRVLAAYLDFEEAATDAGLPRDPAETTARHARRVVTHFTLPVDDARILVTRHAVARFGQGEPTDEDAARAERASSVLCGGIAS